MIPASTYLAEALLMMDQLKTDLIGKSLSGNASPREAEELAAWVNADPGHAETYTALQKTWAAAAQEDLPSFTDGMPTAWDRLAARINAEQVTPNAEPPQVVRAPIRLRPYRQILQLAAALLVGIGLWALVARTMDTRVQQWSTGNHEQLQIELPDGSQVWLNQRSSLQYQGGGQQRQVILQGEAFFDVAKNPQTPFRIFTGSLVTTVLGTRFNVRAYPEEAQISVSVAEGLVALSQKNQADQNIIQLRPGKTGTFSLNDHRLDTLSSTAANIGAWKTQRLIFAATPLTEVVTTLNEYYGTSLRITNPAIATCRFEAQFEGQSLEAVLEVLQAAFPALTISQQGSVYLLGGAGCQ